MLITATRRRLLVLALLALLAIAASGFLLNKTADHEQTDARKHECAPANPTHGRLRVLIVKLMRDGPVMPDLNSA